MAVLPDILEPGLTTVFCGSAASSASARVGAYYAGPGNRFWPALFEAGFTPDPFTPLEFRKVLNFGIGLTDLAKHESGMDIALSSSAYNSGELLRKIETCKPRHLAFTGKRPARIFLLETMDHRVDDYGLQEARIGTTRIFVLPSPSGAARRWWSIEPWRKLAKLHRDTKQGQETGK